ncbi:hypothetical protein SUGI_0067900 [Cryptomeria japonica]|nr:hypothetical protein SUGI_0067900 [Cryptomeria japonica]
MDSEVMGTSFEALAMLGVDYRSLDLLVLDKPCHLMLNQDKPKKEDLHHHGQNCKRMEEKAFKKQDIEICLSREEQDYYFDFEEYMEDPGFMKERLREWVKAVATYVRFLHALPSQYVYHDIR